MARQPRKFLIDQPSQVTALAAPLRWRIVDALAVGGPSSVSEVAQRLACRPEGLYYHIRALLKAGLVVLAEKRRAGRRWEAVYRLAAPRLMIDRRQESKAFKEALARSCAAALRAAARDYRAALEHPDVDRKDAARGLILRRHAARLSARDLERLHVYLAKIAELFEQNRPIRDGREYGLTLVLTPAK